MGTKSSHRLLLERPEALPFQRPGDYVASLVLEGGCKGSEWLGAVGKGQTKAESGHPICPSSQGKAAPWNRTNVKRPPVPEPPTRRFRPSRGGNVAEPIVKHKKPG